MAISKLILNGEVQMDVTSDTVTAGSMLSGTTATKNDGTKATGNIASKSSSDLTVSGATVTAPAGYYANAASKAVATATHPNPSASIASATGVVTASHTQDTGYVTGGTTTGTLNLTTQAGKTVTPTESAQTAVASYRWTTGPVSVAAISSTYVGTGVTRYNSSNMTQYQNTITAPAGYYSTDAIYNVTTYSHTAPTITFASSTGEITARHIASEVMDNYGMMTGYKTTSSTYTLTTQATQEFYPSTADQAIARYKWLTGQQTFKSVITTNLTAANIAEGVVVKVGDANNASRITQVTGTHSGGGSSYTFIASTEYTVSTSNTNATIIGTFDTGDTSIWTSNKMVYVKIRDKAGRRNGYYYGSDSFIINLIVGNGLTSTQSYQITGSSFYQNGSGYLQQSCLIKATASSSMEGYGIYPTYVYNDGSIQLKARYATSTFPTGTIDGTFTVEVYLLDFVNNINPFNG